CKHTYIFFFSSRRRHTRSKRDWSSDVCSSDLSFLQIKKQNELVEVIKETLATPSLAQAQELKRKSQSEELSKDMMMDMLLADKPNQKEKISLKMEEINKYFPKSYTPNQKKEIILKLLGEWHKKREREHSR